jgi:hypothetical protein
MAGVQTIGDNTLEAVCSVMTCVPDYLVMGISAVTFFGDVVRSPRCPALSAFICGFILLRHPRRACNRPTCAVAEDVLF